MTNMGLGIIGCGNISTSYLRLAPLFKGLEVRAVADVTMDAARARARANSTWRRSRWMRCWQTPMSMWSST
ncbi:hypothetical protein [Pseudotabrizicola sediminis]|uniref:hypothetical protein n=1 Tax=Pseudotabrizicola sediminis TaxID=2486418 RepID=UPI001FD8BF61|nr:hypothetical protein [Pseudotabrizicola sediminis]